MDKKFDKIVKTCKPVCATNVNEFLPEKISIYCFKIGLIDGISFKHVFTKGINRY